MSNGRYPVTGADGVAAEANLGGEVARSRIKESHEPTNT